MNRFQPLSSYILFSFWCTTPPNSIFSMNCCQPKARWTVSLDHINQLYLLQRLHIYILKLALWPCSIPPFSLYTSHASSAQGRHTIRSPQEPQLQLSKAQDLATKLQECSQHSFNSVHNFPRNGENDGPMHLNRAQHTFDNYVATCNLHVML